MEPTENHLVPLQWAYPMVWYRPAVERPQGCCKTVRCSSLAVLVWPAPCHPPVSIPPGTSSTIPCLFTSAAEPPLQILTSL
jgi:hypothetical protein